MKPASSAAEIENKMREARCLDASIQAFKSQYLKLLEGTTGFMPEGEIEAIAELPRHESVTAAEADRSLLSKAVVLKLNGGLGTSMGLEKAKSLLPLKDGLNFLDFIARQILYYKRELGSSVGFLLMNSFGTTDDTRAFLKKYPELGDPMSIELLQSQSPKIDASSFKPVSWEANPSLEWCPPGHGDLYPSLHGSGLLKKLLAEGRKYLFVSNADNLGASLDLPLLGYFARSDHSFMMEVAERTGSDRKGGHLTRRGGRMALRELAQCPEGDLAEFQNIEKHRFFNTNNLWIRLDRLDEMLRRHGGFIPLPLIRNQKPVDPRDKKTPVVIQVETAMGAAIEAFPDSGAVVVPRSRFSPVKTTSDLFALRSDAYTISPDWRLVLAPECQGRPPLIELDPEHYRIIDQLEDRCRAGVPSLKNCISLKVEGPVSFTSEIHLSGRVVFRNASATPKTPAPGAYKDCERIL
jgi:UDP-N-acetylglucosamine pyrophosphorylase